MCWLSRGSLPLLRTVLVPVVSLLALDGEFSNDRSNEPIFGNDPSSMVFADPPKLPSTVSLWTLSPGTPALESVDSPAVAATHVPETKLYPGCALHRLSRSLRTAGREGSPLKISESEYELPLYMVRTTTTPRIATCDCPEPHQQHQHYTSSILPHLTARTSEPYPRCMLPYANGRHVKKTPQGRRIGHHSVRTQISNS
ncbi:hypothetical protein R3P38DRAFT_1321198 [Favolaschia claudopus]|uniref:Uncharacterized protein n=1 Tax=Favolaschia claudopus TaxID=2862362 RepID=A0AAW0AUX1_9AGAR